MMLVYAAVLLGILIFVHELGHFIFAKSLGIKVLKFSLGFGPKLIGKKYGETEYLLSAFPLGGYVKMLGQSDTPEEEEVIPEEEKHRAYNSQPIWKRFSVVFSGPFFNLCFAVLIFFLVFMNGVPYMLAEVGDITPNSPAAQQGIMKGDRVIEVDGRQIIRWDEMTEMIHEQPGRELAIKIDRGGSILTLMVRPEKKVVKNLFGEDKEVGLIGITPSGRTEVKQTGIVNAFSLAVSRTWDISVLTLVSMVKLVQRIIPADTIGGPIMIFQMAGQQASHGAMSFFTFMAVISINLGVLNLLPIPVLDGGHILFMGIEAIRRKPLSDKVIIISQKIGLVLLLSLMAFAFYNDIVRLITGKTF
ncbi:MAG: RIP metalloprotease RseP [Nitrospirae bacterium]|nr:RIP metalloprotease RseP [Nitrospirota bacterium]